MKSHIESILIGPEKNFCYLIECLKTHDCALIDPSFECQKLKSEYFDKHPKRKLKYLIATHGHWDHAGGFPEMLKLFPDSKVAAHKIERKRLSGLKVSLDVGLEDQEILNIGELKLKCWHMPGHTEGGACYQLDNFLFTGDTLFVSLCGRTDLPGGNDRDLFESLQRLKSFPKDILIYPGHDYGPTPTSTISRECQTNPAMMARDLTEFKLIP